MSIEKELITTTLDHYLSLVTIVGLVILVIWLVTLLYEWNTKKETKILSNLNKYIIPLGFFISLFGLVSSLYYSEFLGVLPCDLCWLQRVFLYPQVFMFAFAWFKKDIKVFTYSIILSTIGFLIASYHHIMQLGYSVYKPCSSAPFALDCAKPTFIEYGFVTFPLMAVVLFGFLILLALNNCKRK